MKPRNSIRSLSQSFCLSALFLAAAAFAGNGQVAPEHTDTGAAPIAAQPQSGDAGMSHATKAGLVQRAFEDVPPSYWAFSFIETLAQSGITGGCGGNNYCPEDSVTRAQMAVFLERGMRGADYTPPAASGNRFADVGANDFAAGFIEQLANDGITGGCGGNDYCPDDEVTRAQMAVFLLRAKYGSGYNPPAATGDFGDVGPGYWAASWIEKLADDGITGGCGGGNYCPEDRVTRAQMAVFLVRTFTPGAPAAPTGIGVTNNVFTSGVNVSWTDNSDNEDGFVIERSLSQVGGYTVVATVTEDETSYTDNSVAGSTTYWYRVAATSAFGNSDYAGPVSILTIAQADPAPVLTTSTPNSTGNISLTWTYGWPGGLASTQNGYSLEESSISPTSGFTEIYTTVNGNDRQSPRTYNFTRTQPGTYTLYYRVRARLNFGWSDYSNVVQVNVTIPTNTVREYTPTLDNVVIINSLDSSIANTAYPTADLAVGCNWVYSSITGIQNFVCFSSLLWFDVLADIEGRQINSAALYIYPYVLPASFTQYKLWASFSPWTANVTWNATGNMQVYSASGIVFNQPVSTLPIVLDVTTIVQNWANRSWNNYGFWLEDLNIVFPFDTQLRATGFCSNDFNVDCGGPGGRPRLVIDYQ